MSFTTFVEEQLGQGGASLEAEGTIFSYFTAQSSQRYS